MSLFVPPSRLSSQLLAVVQNNEAQILGFSNITFKSHIQCPYICEPLKSGAPDPVLSALTEVRLWMSSLFDIFSSFFTHFTKCDYKLFHSFWGQSVYIQTKYVQWDRSKPKLWVLSDNKVDDTPTISTFYPRAAYLPGTGYHHLGPTTLFHLNCSGRKLPLSSYCSLQDVTVCGCILMTQMPYFPIPLSGNLGRAFVILLKFSIYCNALQELDLLDGKCSNCLGKS